jgi:hypothetical protein
MHISINMFGTAKFSAVNVQLFAAELLVLVYKKRSCFYFFLYIHGLIFS